MRPANLQQEWARTLLSSLADAGVRRVIVSPGSRSTAFLLAALEHPDLDCLDLLDERVAAFYALGQGRASGVPSLLLCTSGTAAANYLPAVVEAGADHVPLLILSADRPLELTGCGANQTIDQQDLYGRHARQFFDLGIADSEPAAFAGLRRKVAQAVHATTYPEPGAVHLNARARKPLEPALDAGIEPATPEAKLAQWANDLRGRPSAQVAVPDQAVSERHLRQLAEQMRRAERPLVICGPAPICPVPISRPNTESPLSAVLAATGSVLLAESASQLRFAATPESPRIDGFDTIMRSAAASEALAADFVLQIGRAPTSSSWAPYLERCAPSHWVLAAHGWHDPTSSADQLLIGDPRATWARLAAILAEEPVDPASAALREVWQTAWWQADRLAWEATDASLVEAEVFSEGTVARQTVAALPDGALLALGNSLPIRHVDTFCRGRAAGLSVWSQRGASGIDGVISGSAGAASVLQRPAALLIGDVSFLHDLGGLAAAAQLKTPFALVVIHNQGGRIFEQLPLASHPETGPAEIAHWTTPHDLRLAPAAELFGLRHREVGSAEELGQALAEALTDHGAERNRAMVIEARVPPGDAAERRRDIDRRFGASWPPSAGVL